MIDKRTGEITLDTGKAIYATIGLDKVKAFSLGEAGKETDMRTGWIQYFVSNVKVANKFFNFTFFFYEDRLDRVSFVFDNSPFVPKNGWDSWSEKKEREKMEIYNEWLNKEIGADRNFSWGNVGASFDTKGGYTSIYIRYKT